MMCFGISVPEHFQRRVNKVLEGMPGMLCHMDNILVRGATFSKQNRRLEEVLANVQAARVTLNDKC